MGTNYYLMTGRQCERCNEPEKLHIGKSSGGWVFALHVIPELGINTLADWQRLLRNPKAFIKDEYGNDVSAEELHKVITERSWAPRKVFTSTPYKDENDLLARNHAEWGPNNLLRSKIDGVRCIGHGPGTYDYIASDFS